MNKVKILNRVSGAIILMILLCTVLELIALLIGKWWSYGLILSIAIYAITDVIEKEEVEQGGV